jgi:hypothetical protein
MKKPVIFAILLVFAVALLWGLDYLSSQSSGNKDNGAVLVNEPKVVKDFKSFCDTLRDGKWNPTAFQERVDRLNVYREQKIVTASEFMNLETYMYSAYANSIINSFEEWKQSCEDASLVKLNKEIKRVSNLNTTCNTKLEATSKEIAGYYILKSTPVKVTSFVSGEFDEGAYNRLKQQINNLPSGFSNCSGVNQIKSQSLKKIQDFKTFVGQFNDALSAFKRKNDYYTRSEIQSLCKTVQLNNFNYYKPFLNSTNVCN